MKIHHAEIPISLQESLCKKKIYVYIYIYTNVMHTFDSGVQNSYGVNPWHLSSFYARKLALGHPNLKSFYVSPPFRFQQHHESVLSKNCLRKKSTRPNKNRVVLVKTRLTIHVAYDEYHAMKFTHELPSLIIFCGTKNAETKQQLPIGVTQK